MKEGVALYIKTAKEMGFPYKAYLDGAYEIEQMCIRDRRRHADRLPGLLPRLGEHQGRRRDDRPDHRRQIHRRLSHAEDILSLTGPAHRDRCV